MFLCLLLGVFWRRVRGSKGKVFIKVEARSFNKNMTDLEVLFVVNLSAAQVRSHVV